ncbi:hypothetical protein KCTC32516_02382 [Polaribacter huanghezhanensis]|uniref:DUF5606 family protein n=1 Tax=Polaribacter huanghezhanensis TaxID=1354726 RepID=UPI0026475D24|nr:DUF5606 domain-containing protein [Polaribacter huanghezhanensis]WKD87002.1 hypothetical protein KCTC32516_02382 [Polaribacter huanghezhanensis]
MEFNKIIAVTGKPGLFHVVSQTKTGIVVEALSDKKRFPILSTQNVSLLENIAIFTYEEEVPLLTVFKSIFEKEEGKETISHKESGAKLTSFFSEILPDFDQERVYTSNIKKIIQWYNMLIATEFDFSTAKLSVEATEQA